MVYFPSAKQCFSWVLLERVTFVFGDKRSHPNPYDYPSADDYYQAVEDYHQWLKDKEEADAEAADIAYEKSLEEKWSK